MKATPTERRPAPTGAPVLKTPVLAAMDAPLFYVTDNGPGAWKHAIYCESLFAETVLAALDDIATTYHLGICHLGIYNARYARHKDGSPIQPIRWSNHAYGMAMDFKGVRLDGDKEYLPITAMRKHDTGQQILAEINARCNAAIKAAGKRPEIVDEGDWLHIGIYP